MVARLLCMNKRSNAAEGLGFDPQYLHFILLFVPYWTGSIACWTYVCPILQGWQQDCENRATTLGNKHHFSVLQHIELWPYSPGVVYIAIQRLSTTRRARDLESRYVQGGHHAVVPRKGRRRQIP